VRVRKYPHEHGSTSLLIVDDALSATGSVRWVNTLAEQWIASGLSVRMFLLQDRPRGPVAAPARGVSLTFGGRRGVRLRGALPSSLPGVTREVIRADLVLVPSEVSISLPLCYITCRTIGRRPLIIMAQSLMEASLSTWVPRRWRGLWLYCLRRADAVVAVSQESAESVRRVGVPSERVSVVHPGMNVDEVVRQAQSSSPQVVVTDEPVLLSCADLTIGKGHDLLIRALAMVRARGFRARLVILGEGSERASLEQLAADLDVADCVRLSGFVANPYPEMLAADLFCLASRYESFGLCLLEAMALEVPTLATDADGGGPRLLLDGGRLGSLVPPNSVEELAEAIVTHLKQPEVLRSRAAAGPAHVRQFTPEAGAAAYRDVFSQVIRRVPNTGETAAARPRSTLRWGRRGHTR
jgi:glycosyltransferase involved in cell wall biosynthesis